jgi:hypothetical protein
MKLTRKSLRTLISKELLNQNSILLEMPERDEEHDQYKEREDSADDPDGHKDEMVKRSLYHMSQQSQQLHDMLTDDENLEPWVQDKISKAADFLEQAFKAVTYDKGPGQGRR